jgi:hypothetical protein
MVKLRSSVVGQFELYWGGWGRGFASPQDSQRLGAHFVRAQPPELKLTHYSIIPHQKIVFMSIFLLQYDHRLLSGQYQSGQSLYYFLSVPIREIRGSILLIPDQYSILQNEQFLRDIFTLAVLCSNFGIVRSVS